MALKDPEHFPDQGMANDVAVGEAHDRRQPCQRIRHGSGVNASWSASHSPTASVC